MKIISIITLFTSQILFLFSISAANTTISSDSIDTGTIQFSSELKESPAKVSEIDSAILKASQDSIKRENLRQLLLEKEHKRLSEHHHQNTDLYTTDPHRLNSSFLFLTDGTTPSEALRSHPLITTARYGLSTSLNRYMLYGAVAPVNKIRTGNLLYETNSSLIKGTDQISLVDISDIQFNNSGELRYLYHPAELTSPEALILWENGVFSENLLQVSFARPFSKSLVVNAFTNYRYFKKGDFTQSPDIRSFYGSVADTTYIPNKGYNPLTDEFFAGTSILWLPKEQSRLQLKLTYGDLKHEICLDRPVDDREELNHAIYKRYPFQIDLNSSWKFNNPFFIDFEAKFRDEPQIRISGDSVDNILKSIRTDAKDREIAAALRSGIKLLGKDSLSLSYNLNRTAYSLFDKSHVLSFLHRVETQYNYHFRLLNFDGHVQAGAGLTYFSQEDTSEIAEIYNIATSIEKENQHYRFYFQKDNIPFTINYDSLVFDQVLLDPYYKAGAEAFFGWHNVNLLLGYQMVYGTDSTTVRKFWPNGIVPYQQPVSSFVIAPTLGRWHGLALRTSAIISDCKPYLKLHSALSFLAHPSNTREYIDIALTFDYWTERELITFAGFKDWNIPIYNLGLEMAAHIRSFRLFYKVDNILNRRHAYVPGYYSSGITFRWGFNWYLQR